MMLRLGPKKGYAALKRQWLVVQMQTRREGRVLGWFGLQRWKSRCGVADEQGLASGRVGTRLRQGESKDRYKADLLGAGSWRGFNRLARDVGEDKEEERLSRKWRTRMQTAARTLFAQDKQQRSWASVSRYYLTTVWRFASAQT
jgi:hypothetical protein